MISWPNLRKLTALTASSGLAANQANHIADGRIGIETQQQIRTGQFEEMHAVALDDLAHVHQFAQQAAGRGGGQPITSSPALAEARWWLTGQMPQMRGVMMRHFKNHAAFAEFFKTAEFVDMQVGMVHSHRLRHPEMVTLAWPSMRVTGSIVIFCATILLPPVNASQLVVFKFRFAALGQFAQDIKDRIRIGRAARDKDIDRDNFLKCAHPGGNAQFGIIRESCRWNPCFRFRYRPVRRDSSMVKKLRMAGTPPNTAQSPKATRILQRLRMRVGHFFVGGVIDAAFQDADIHAGFIRLL